MVEDVWPFYQFFKWLTTFWFEDISKDIPAQLQQIWTAVANIIFPVPASNDGWVQAEEGAELLPNLVSS